MFDGKARNNSSSDERQNLWGGALNLEGTAESCEMRAPIPLSSQVTMTNLLEPFSRHVQSTSTIFNQDKKTQGNCLNGAAKPSTPRRNSQDDTPRILPQQPRLFLCVSEENLQFKDNERLIRSHRKSVDHWILDSRGDLIHHGYTDKTIGRHLRDEHLARALFRHQSGSSHYLSTIHVNLS